MLQPLIDKNQQLMAFAIAEADFCAACINYLKQYCNETDLHCRSRDMLSDKPFYISTPTLKALKTSPAALHHSSIAVIGSVV